MLVARVCFRVWHVSLMFYLSFYGNDVLSRFTRLFWKICILHYCSIESPDILSQSVLLIQDNQGTGEQLVRRPGQPKSKLHLWASSAASTESSLMRTRAICSHLLNDVCMDGCWLLVCISPSFCFNGSDWSFLTHIAVWTICWVVEMHQPFRELESTLIFWRHVSTFLLAIGPYGMMESILNLNLGV